MSLRARLGKTKALASEGSSTVASPEGNGALLPYDLVSDVLETHAVVAAANAQPREVHRALCRLMDGKALLPSSSQSTQPPPPPPMRHQTTCLSCHGHNLELDAREGSMVCRDCGVVCQTQLNVVLEWRNDPEVSPAATAGVPGISEWMLARDAAQRERCLSSHQGIPQLLEHYNCYAHLGSDLLEEAAHSFRTLRKAISRHEIHASEGACIAAALLFSMVKSRLPDEQHIRKCAKRMQHLPTVDACAVQATFPCPNCHTMTFSSKCARMHCRKWGQRKR